jgi:hypothetical protein
MEYVAIIIKDKENVESATIYAHDDAEAYENARDWAAGLNLPRDYEVWWAVKTPDNSEKLFLIPTGTQKKPRQAVWVSLAGLVRNVAR